MSSKTGPHRDPADHAPRARDTTYDGDREPRSRGGARACHIADALDLIGDRWSLLVLREINLGVRRFNDIATNTGAPRETLTLRLRKLEQGGIITRREYSEHPPRHEYALTAAGEEAAPLLAALRDWGERHA